MFQSVHSLFWSCVFIFFLSVCLALVLAQPKCIISKCMCYRLNSDCLCLLYSIIIMIRRGKRMHVEKRKLASTIVVDTQATRVAGDDRQFNIFDVVKLFQFFFFVVSYCASCPPCSRRLILLHIFCLSVVVVVVVKHHDETGISLRPANFVLRCIANAREKFKAIIHFMVAPDNDIRSIYT